jgi:hypothetical protein
LVLLKIHFESGAALIRIRLKVSGPTGSGSTTLCFRQIALNTISLHITRVDSLKLTARTAEKKKKALVKGLVD